MIVRPAAPGDARAIATVHVDSWRSTYRGAIPDEVLDNLSVDSRTRSWTQLIVRSGDGASGVLVLEDGVEDESNREVIGFCHWGHSRDPDADPITGEVTAIYLLASRWRRGGGRALIDAAAEAMAAAGYRRAILWVLASNRRAQSFYAAAGWRPDGATKTDDQGSFQLDEVRYTRDL